MALTPTLKVDDFSSTEALTNKVFEGKPVYSKVFTGTTGSSSDYEVGTVSDSMADLVNVYVHSITQLK